MNFPLYYFYHINLYFFIFFHQFFWHLNQIIKRTFFCFSSKHVKAIKKHILLILNEFHVTNFFLHILLLCYLNLTLWWILLQLIQMRIFFFCLFFLKKMYIILKTVVYTSKHLALHRKKKIKERNTSDMNWSLLIHLIKCIHVWYRIIY